MLNFTDLQRQIAVTLLPKFGRKRMRTVLAHTETLEAFFHEKKQNLIKIPGIGEAYVRQLKREEALEKAFSYAEYFMQSPFQTHFFQDQNFPRRLNECADGPLMLYSYGKMDLNVSKTVAIVGTRNASDYGKRICEDLIQSFSGKNILVVSGLAYGIDIAVHQACVKHQVQTIGVLGHGLDRIYPDMHRKTAKDMIKNGGLLTEFLPGTNPDKENFPMRNRIVAGMCDATIVVESGIKGGSLITAELANDYNREVFAFPGDVLREYSKGCHFLIQKNKAHLITSSKDFFQMMAWSDAEKNTAKQGNLFEGLNEGEKNVIRHFMEKTELSFDQLIQRSKLSFTDLSSILLSLEFVGMIKSAPGKVYQAAFK